MAEIIARVTDEMLRRQIAGRLRLAFDTDDRAETAGLDARLIVAHALACRPEDLGTAGKLEVPPDAERLALALAARRAAGEPVARLTARKEFYGLDLALSDDTLIPRPDTETLVDAALAAVERLGARQRLTVLDLGTGAGGILLALLARLPQAIGVGVDLSSDAVATAKRNARDLNLDDRSSFVVGDWAAAIGGRFDFVVANPPYIPTADIDLLPIEVCRHDPRLALDGADDGLVAYRMILPILPGLMTEDGLAFMEIGYDQAAAVCEMAASCDFHCKVFRDLGGRDRVIELIPRRAPGEAVKSDSDDWKMGLGNQARNG